MWASKEMASKETTEILGAQAAHRRTAIRMQRSLRYRCPHHRRRIIIRLKIVVAGRKKNTVGCTEQVTRGAHNASVGGGGERETHV